MDTLWLGVALAVLVGAWLLVPYLRWRGSCGRPLEEHVARTSFQCTPGELVPPAWRAPQVSLSVVVPAYNEEHRLPQMLGEAFAYLEGRAAAGPPGFSYEVIVVDDGSTDGTYQAALGSWRGMQPRGGGGGELRAIRLSANHGKGFAVKVGALAARGQLLLMADADGSTCIRDVERLEQVLSEQGGDFGAQVAFGSRHHLRKVAAARQSVAMSLLLAAFRVVLWPAIGGPVHDTQCGFKLFRAAAGKRIFGSLHLRGWAFDIEVLILARLLGARIAEVPVTWVEMPGSKLDATFGATTMLRDAILVQLLYMFRVWRPSVMAG